jgi:hypothetical protein
MENQREEAMAELPLENVEGGIDRTEQLLLPTLLVYLDFSSLVEISRLNKRFNQLIKDENSCLAFWPAVCNSFCIFRGLYSPVLANPENVIPQFNYRKHFFDDLWTLRNKWTNQSRENLSYKVRVSCRFRPGDTPGGRVCLPLHQFLRIRRQKKAQLLKDGELSANFNEENPIFVGDRDPDEFCDPFLGSLMRDPVLMTTSNRIVDRTVAMQCIQRGGRDPFNGMHLTLQMLQPQLELAAKIQSWRDRPERSDVSVDIKDAKNLIDEVAVNQDLLETLLEVERMRKMVNKTKMMELAPNRSMIPEDMFVFDDDAIETYLNDPPVQEDNLINPDITVGLIDEEIGPFEANPFPVEHLLLLNAHLGNHREQPSNKNEAARIVEVHERSSFVSMYVPGTGVRSFNFSNVFSPNISQQQLYQKTAKESVEFALNGCNACVLCYGQTGSGKTYSFLGPEGALEREERNQETSAGNFSILPGSGMLLHAAAEFFRARSLLTRRNGGVSIGVKIQIVEVYDEKVTDLMSGRIVAVQRDTGHVVNGSEIPCESLLEFIHLYKIAHGRQRFAETAMNERSSRAHTLVIFHIAQKRSITSESLSVPSSTPNAVEVLVNSQLYLVDLAGSERVKKSKVTGQQMREAVGINSSLLVLGRVISSLVEGHKHVPYLECKLTTLLRAAFGGNSKTMVLVNARIEEEHGDETLQSLRFGERCGMISNSLKQLATSFDSTVKAMDDALALMQDQMQKLSLRGKQHLSSYKALEVNYGNLLRRKQELLALNAICSDVR